MNNAPGEAKDDRDTRPEAGHAPVLLPREQNLGPHRLEGADAIAAPSPAPRRRHRTTRDGPGGHRDGARPAHDHRGADQSREQQRPMTREQVEVQKQARVAKEIAVSHATPGLRYSVVFHQRVEEPSTAL